MSCINSATLCCYQHTKWNHFYWALMYSWIIACNSSLSETSCALMRSYSSYSCLKSACAETYFFNSAFSEVATLNYCFSCSFSATFSKANFFTSSASCLSLCERLSIFYSAVCVLIGRKMYMLYNNRHGGELNRPVYILATSFLHCSMFIIILHC